MADATIRQDMPDNNYGTITSLTSGLSSDGSSLARALLKFDLSGIPTNATITNITLSLTELTQPSVQSTFLLSPLLANWIETQVTWNDSASGAAWSDSGGDFSFDSAAEFFITHGPGTTNQFTDDGEFPGYGLVADVQFWITNSAQNFGWILTARPEDTAGNAYQFGSRENPGFQPVLTVEYTVPFAPPKISSASITNGQFCFTFNIEPFHGYLIQTTSDLTNTNWGTILVLDPASTPQEATLCFTLTPTNQFYRVRSD